MSDLFEKSLNALGIKVNLSGDTYESEQRYRLVVALITFLSGFLYLPISAVLWIITVIKIKNYLKARKEYKRS